MVGILVVANAWAVIDAKMAASAAAREAVRAYVETRAGDDPIARARSAADSAIQGVGRDPRKLTLVPVDASFERCAEVTFEARYPIPLLTIPLIGRFGSGFTAVSRHSEIVDPFRDAVPEGARTCDEAA